MRNTNMRPDDAFDDAKDIWTTMLEPTRRLGRDLRIAARSLGDTQARHLVDSYYIMQEDRKRAFAQERSLQANNEPSSVISWLAVQAGTLEDQIKTALDVYTANHMMGNWMRQIYGIGPVLSAGLLAHIDISKVATAGNIWQFCGWAADGQHEWKKGEKRPFNADLKVLCWKVGQSFMKFSNNEKCFYGRIYRERKAREIVKNDNLEFQSQAAVKAAIVGKTTEAYKAYSIGKLPPAHIDARARRYAVKLFLAHMFEEWYRRHNKKEPPVPYPIAFLGHAHVIKAPI